MRTSSVERHASIERLTAIACDGCGIDPGSIDDGLTMTVDYGIIGLRRAPLVLCAACLAEIAKALRMSGHAPALVAVEPIDGDEVSIKMRLYPAPGVMLTRLLGTCPACHVEHAHGTRREAMRDYISCGGCGETRPASEWKVPS